MTRNQEEWINEYKRRKGFWVHDGNRKRPHPRLTSELHSNGFFNSRMVIPDEVLLRDAASDLLELFARAGGDINLVDGVVGPQTGATKLAEFMSDQICAFKRDDCFFVSPAKGEEGGKKFMSFTAEDMVLLRNATVLLCDDVLTTAGSVRLTEQAVLAAGGAVLPYILVLVNRSGLTQADGKPIIALINYPMPTWTAEECDLCKVGSPVIPAKDNWEALNANYS